MCFDIFLWLSCYNPTLQDLAIFTWTSFIIIMRQVKARCLALAWNRLHQSNFISRMLPFPYPNTLARLYKLESDHTQAIEFDRPKIFDKNLLNLLLLSVFLDLYKSFNAYCLVECCQVVGCELQEYRKGAFVLCVNHTLFL